LSGWNPTYVEFCAYGTSAGILLEGKFKQSVGRYKLLNCYAPYKDRESFWQPLIDSGLLYEEGLIVGGDLNFTLTDREFWGEQARSDPIADLFSRMILSSGLVYLQPIKITPTWRNGRASIAGISKRLDRFLLNESLISSHKRLRSWVVNSSILDHNPICLQLEMSSLSRAPPFKFNNSWFYFPYKGNLAFNEFLVRFFFNPSTVQKIEVSKGFCKFMAEEQKVTNEHIAITY